ncbi:MAG: hypothetical protein QG597_4857 [Actinomycetota bacterium]|nr:hypothetical protein [Actinomycetota bacterium]
MIPDAAITAWGRTRPWPSREQVEQDLLLSRVIVEIYNHDVLRDELLFRGGTCLHQVRLPSPLRYSEDLDFVRRTHTGIGHVFDALREVADTVGLTVISTDVGVHPKIKFRAAATGSILPLRIKVEVNTHETSPALPVDEVPFTLTTSWFQGRCVIRTFETPELVATKLRALYQRSKGRDLFDLWLALAQMRLNPEEIVECFTPYRPDGYTAALAISNLRKKLRSPDFRDDMSLLVTELPLGYDVDDAAERIIDELISRVPK